MAVQATGGGFNLLDDTGGYGQGQGPTDVPKVRVDRTDMKLRVSKDQTESPQLRVDQLDHLERRVSQDPRESLQQLFPGDQLQGQFGCGDQNRTQSPGLPGQFTDLFSQNATGSPQEQMNKFMQFWMSMFQMMQQQMLSWGGAGKPTV